MFVSEYLKGVLIIVLFMICQNLLGQPNIGISIVKNYLKEDYQGGLQNWDVGQDTDGKMYFANSQGLMTFDGANWKVIPVENGTIVRSLLIEGNRIYLGSQGDFGYFEPNEKGILIYHGLKDKLPRGEQNFADVWKISKNNEEIVFRTTDQAFTYSLISKRVEAYSLNKNFTFSNEKNQITYLHLIENNLPDFNNQPFQNISEYEVLKGTIITSVIPIDSQFLLTTVRNGIFRYDGENFIPWEMNDHEMIKNHQINCSVRIDKERIAIGTLTGGLFIVNNNRQVLYHLDINNGLQSNHITNIFKDGTGNLWLVLSKGIDYIEINSPFSLIKPNQSFGATGYDVRIHNNQLYLGTSNGLYSTIWKDYYHPLKNQSFELVRNTRGQVWNLDVQKNELLLGHHQGAFRVEGNHATPISNQSGTWLFKTLFKNDNLLLSGSYEGLSIYGWNNGHWQFQRSIKGIEESCRFIEQDKSGNIWIAHPYRGIYKLALDKEQKQVSSIKLYNKENGLPSAWGNVFKIGESIIFTSVNGVYSYDATHDSFELSKVWSEVIDPKSRVLKLTEDKVGNIWFVIDNEVGVFKVKDLGLERKVEKLVFPKLTKQLVGGFENIYLYDEENVFFPLENGFMHFNPKKYNVSDTLFHTHIQEVKLGDSTIVFGGWQNKEWEKPSFKHDENAFVFRYAASEYRDFNLVKFQYLLKGLDNDWSPWTHKNIKEYTELPPGEYRFQVRAKNALGQITEIKSFKFEIRQPWYATFAAKAIYAIIIIGVLVSLVLIPYRKYTHETALLKEEQEKNLQETEKEYQKIVTKNEAEISELQAEKLKAEIQFKNQELATTTMHLVQKGELITKLKENLDKILKNTKEANTKKNVRGTISLLNQDAQLDGDWEQFAQYFDQVHVDFLKRLKETYPQLTPKDQKLCTYLKMNLSTKDIVPLMNISVRGVEVSRYRLRKKIDLGSDVNLNEFMMNF